MVFCRSRIKSVFLVLIPPRRLSSIFFHNISTPRIWQPLHYLKLSPFTFFYPMRINQEVWIRSLYVLYLCLRNSFVNCFVKFPASVCHNWGLTPYPDGIYHMWPYTGLVKTSKRSCFLKATLLGSCGKISLAVLAVLGCWLMYFKFAIPRNVRFMLMETPNIASLLLLMPGTMTLPHWTLSAGSPRVSVFSVTRQSTLHLRSL